MSRFVVDTCDGMWLDNCMETTTNPTTKIRKAEHLPFNRTRLYFIDGTTVNTTDDELWMFYEVHGFPMEVV